MSSLALCHLEDLGLVADRRLLLPVDIAGTRVLDWAESNAGEIDRLLQANGALLIRGLKIMSSKEFGQALSALFGEPLLNYAFRSTPRTELRGNVYTATEYHAGETIPQHNENAYSNQWPMRIGFLCMVPSDNGGATPLADSREVYQRIPAAVRQKFEAKGVMYVRNYGDIDLPWTEVFQTEDRDEVERYCCANQIECEWRSNGMLRTRQINPATAIHPVTGERVWFNQAHLFHVSALAEEVRDSILAAVGEEDIPRNASYGDGTPIEAEALQAIREAYAAATFAFPWQRDDLLLLDNMLYTHGRQPFTGDRKVLVGMARAMSSHAIAELLA
ncbi:TauD/TfdA family dioxygenase [Aquimonas sp.]|uniref:TauD/TfdA family dioxygenase n=1 Tax=Aquimonas sp. TaxID=1872588 RepID=UPI0037BFD8BC